MIYSLPLALDGLAALLFMGVRAVHHSADEDETMAKQHRLLTIAEAKAADLTHLNVACSDCGSITMIPWQLMPNVGTHRVIDALKSKLRCRKCGGRADPESVYPTNVHEGQPKR